MAEEEPRALDVITAYGQAETDAVNIKNLYQRVADLMFPRENQILVTTTEGEQRNADIHDPTGQIAKDDMASGLSVNLFPPGQHFHIIQMEDRELNEIPEVKRTLGIINEIVHEKRNASNFRMEVDETLKSHAAFGTGNLFSCYKPGIGLNYKDWDVGQYFLRQNHMGLVDTVYMKFPLTALQAVDMFGDKVNEKVLEALKEEKTANKKFEYICVRQPRRNRNRTLIDPLNMEFEEVCVSVEDKVVVHEDGFEEFPHFVSRWAKSSTEAWGRGQGVTALPSVEELQTMAVALKECANKWNDPPKEVVGDDIEDDVDVRPGALNDVARTGTIKAIDQGIRGNFPITKDILEMKQELVKEIFFNSVFQPVTPLKGDRRNEMEIRERITESFQKLGSPIGRLHYEMLRPMVERDVFLLLRNGELPPLPAEMRGRAFKINFIGRLAMELKSAQSQGWLRWAGIGGELKAVFPSVTDNISIDSGFRRLGETLGVAIEDINAVDEVDGIRDARAEREQQEKQMELAAQAAGAYPGATKAPEPGSAAELMMSV